MANGGSGGAFRYGAPPPMTIDRWAGAALRQTDADLPADDPILRVEARWTVPRMFYPVTKKGDFSHDGHYQVSTWVGIDGLGTLGNLRAGVAVEAFIFDGDPGGHPIAMRG